MTQISRHPRHVAGWNGTLEELAQAVGNMTYDQTAEFLNLLSEDLKKQAQGDQEKGRSKLSGFLRKTANEHEYATNPMNQAWQVCKLYMHEDDLDGG